MYAARRNITDKVAGSVIDDAEGRELYLGYASRGSVRVVAPFAGGDRCPRLSGVLADVNYLHTRYFGSGKQEDFRV